MSSENEIKRDCTKCIYFDIETVYGVCTKHGIIINPESLCKDYEEITNERSRKATSERNFGIMGVNGMNSADIFDEYFDDEKPKYIIRNCDCILSSGRCNVKSLVYCQDCTDCAMKQIVEKCKKEIIVYRNTLLPNDGTNTLHFGRQSFAYDILKLLDIQEAECEESKTIKRSECPYGGIDCAWCTEDCE